MNTGKKEKKADPRQEQWTTNAAIHRLEKLGYTVIPPNTGKKKPVDQMTEEELIAEDKKTKATRAAYIKEYRKRNPEKFQEYRKRNQEKFQEYAKRYAETHREQMREASRRSYQKRKAREHAIKERLEALQKEGAEE